MKNYKNLAFGLSLILLMRGEVSLGWGDLGHEMVGEIAYRNLTPQARRMVFELLGAEPLANVATFPDAVRSEKAFSKFSPFHFFEIPPGKTVAQAIAEHPTRQNADTLIRTAESMVPRKGPDANLRAILLKYLVHAVGDVHQPLHVGNGVDRGANLCKVNWVNPFTGKTESSNLHTVWDTNIFDYLKKDFEASRGPAGGNKYYFNYNDAIELVMAKFSEDKLKELKKKGELPPEEWYAESYALHSKVYPDKTLVANPKDRSYCTYVDEKGKEVKREIDPANIPTLDEAYGRNALAIAQERVLLGGFRLAHMLNEMSKNYKTTSTEENPMAKFLESLAIEKLAPPTNVPARPTGGTPEPKGNH